MRWLAPWQETLREISAMRYLWQVPVRMRNDSLLQWLGQEPHTPLEESVETTLRGLGCLNPSLPATAPA